MLRSLEECSCPLAQDLVPEVDEKFFDVFETRVEGAVSETGDAPDVSKRDGVNSITKQQYDCGGSN